MNPPEINSLNPQDENPKFEPQSSKTNFSSNFSNGSKTLPNSVGVLVLGILSICFCWCYGLLSIIMGIIAIVLSGSAEKLYKANPEEYSIASYKNLKAGKICAIIGLCLSAIWIVYLIILFATVGFGSFALMDALKHR